MGGCLLASYHGAAKARSGRRRHDQDLSSEGKVRQEEGGCGYSPHSYEKVAQCLVPVAYFTGEDLSAASRPPVENVIYWNGWDNMEPAT
jgi:hypothetical protein